jgi:hypothetical protein
VHLMTMSLKLNSVIRVAKVIPQNDEFAATAGLPTRRGAPCALRLRLRTARSSTLARWVAPAPGRVGRVAAAHCLRGVDELVTNASLIAGVGGGAVSAHTVVLRVVVSGR